VPLTKCSRSFGTIRSAFHHIFFFSYTFSLIWTVYSSQSRSAIPKGHLGSWSTRQSLCLLIAVLIFWRSSIAYQSSAILNKATWEKMDSIMCKQVLTVVFFCCASFSLSSILTKHVHTTQLHWETGLKFSTNFTFTNLLCYQYCVKTLISYFILYNLTSAESKGEYQRCRQHRVQREHHLCRNKVQKYRLCRNKVQNTAYVVNRVQRRTPLMSITQSPKENTTYVVNRVQRRIRGSLHHLNVATPLKSHKDRSRARQPHRARETTT